MKVEVNSQNAMHHEVVWVLRKGGEKQRKIDTKDRKILFSCFSFVWYLRFNGPDLVNKVFNFYFQGDLL
jgi:hypothetical protein